MVLFLTISGITDILKRKIYNVVTFPVMVMGFALNFYLGGLNALISSLAGFGICTILFFMVYAWGGFGAGDAKLMMALGAIVGLELVFNFILYSVLAGGLMANIVIIKKRRFIKTWKRVLRFFLFMIPKYRLKSESLSKDESIAIPYGYAVSLGSLTYCIVLVFNIQF
ncbi:MAG: A24 family peptidase [Spirochaetes bacterium]|nr:A24 family peptidase [Spirochaetota bacterium]